LSHWLNVPILFGMIATGLSIYWAAPVFEHARDATTGSTDYIADLGIWIVRHVPGASGDHDPGGWVYNRVGIGTFHLALALRLHWLFASLFMASGLLYVLGLFLGEGSRALLPRLSDAPEALKMMRYYAGVLPAKLLRRPWPPPPVRSKYNALQRGAYFFVPIFAILAVASGWAMHKPAQLKWLEPLFLTYHPPPLVHFWVMVCLAAFVVPPVFSAFADGWDTIRSMIVGWSERIRAESPHGKA